MFNPVRHLFFDKDERESALRYLVMKFFNGMENKMDTRALAAMIDMMYGVNTVKMANYLAVETTIVEKYEKAILEYCSFVDIDAEIMSYNPGQFVVKSIVNQALKGPESFAPLMYWDPGREWNFNNVPKEGALMNPLNHYVHSSLTLKNVEYQKLRNFAVKALREDFKLLNKAFNDLDKQSMNKTATLTIELLPCDTYKNIINITDTLYLYF